MTTKIRPQVSPDWATDDDYTNGVATGTPTKIDPGSAIAAEGILPEVRVSAQRVNFAINKVGQWANYYRDLDWLNWLVFNPRQFQPGWNSEGGGNEFDGGKLVAVASRKIEGGDSFLNNQPALVGITDVVAGNNDLVVSFDGISWVVVAPANFTSVMKQKSIIYSEVAGLWIALGASASTKEIMTSSDPLSTWDGQDDPETDSDRNAIAESDSIVVIVRSAGNLLSSTDGTTWTGRTNPNPANALYGVAWGNDTFVAVGDDSVIVSADGIDWFDMTGNVPAPLSGTIWKDITFSPGLGLFLAIGGAAMMTSPDGVVWTQRDVDPSLPGTTLDCVVADEGIAIYATTGITISKQLFLRSLDGGITWEVQHVAFLLTVIGMAFGVGRMILYGEAHDVNATNPVFGIALSPRMSLGDS